MKKKISAGKQKGGKSAALLIAGMVAATLLLSMLCAALMEKGVSRRSGRISVPA